MAKQNKSGRRLKFGMLATGTTVIFLAIVVIVNVIATMLLERYPVSIDITKDQIYQLDDKSVDYVKKLDSEITVSVLSTKAEFQSILSYYGASSYIDQTDQFLKRLTQYNPKIKLNYMSIDKNPDFVAKYSDENLTAMSIVVQGSKRYKVLSVDQLFNFEANQYTQETTVKSSKVEETVLSAIMYVTDENPVRAAVITGHNEIPLFLEKQTQGTLTGLGELLAMNNYDIQSVRLSTDDLGEENDVVIIAAPNSDYNDVEIKKLNDYLYNGGKFGKKVIYLAEATRPKLPKLEAFLAEEWGIAVGDGYLLETDQNNMFQNEAIIALNYADETYSSVIKDQTATPMFVTQAKPLTALFEEKGNRSTEVLLKTAKTAVVCPSNASKKWKPKDGVKGEYPVGIIAKRKGVYDNNTVESTVLVTTVSVMNDTISYFDSNRLYTINMMDTLTQRESGITLLPKTVEKQSIGLNVAQVKIYAVIFIGVVPALCLIAGFIIWLRRRHK